MNCPNCQNVVSAKANACPACGHPMEDAGGTALAVISIVFGVLAFLILAHVFGATAIVCGIIAGSKGRKLGWVGMALGIINVVIWGVLFIMVTRQA